MTRPSRSSAWRRRSLPRRAAIPLLAAGACCAGLVCVYIAAFGVAVTERADANVLDGFQSLATPATWESASRLTEFLNLRPFAIAVVLALGFAVLIRREREALAAALIFVGANVSTQLISTLSGENWPSGHVTAAASLAACAVLVAPVALRPYAAGAGALGVLTIAYSILLIGAHRPSDVLAGLLMTGVWSGLAVAGLELAWPAGRSVAVAARRRTLWLAGGAAVVAVGALLALVATVAPLPTYVDEHTMFVAGALVLAACGAALPALLNPRSAA